MFPKIGVPQNLWSIMENPIKMDDLGVPLFLETSIYSYLTYSSLIPSSPISPLRLGWKGPTGRDDFGFLTLGVSMKFVEPEQFQIECSYSNLIFNCSLLLHGMFIFTCILACSTLILFRYLFPDHFTGIVCPSFRE